MRLSIGKLARAVWVTLILFALIDSEAQAPALRERLVDGWNTWRVAAAHGAGQTCCFSWSRGKATPQDCNLDTRQSYTSDDRSPSPGAGQMQIYALLHADKVTSIRALSPQCPVVANSDIHDLGVIGNGDSVSWLDEQVSPRGDVSSDALMAIASHAGPESVQALIGIGRADEAAENREDAIFWMAEAGFEDAEREVERALADDPSAGVREHAVFALTLLPDGRPTAGLIGVLENRGLGMHLRERALFWLAQSEADEAFAYLSDLLADN